MPTAVETLSPTRVRLTVDVPFADLKPEIDAAYKAIGQQVRVQGFRPGKVPPKILDQRVGRGPILDEAMQKAVPRLYGEAVEESGVKPLAPPELEVTKIDDNVELTFTAEVDVRPDFALPTYEDLAVTVDAVAATDEEVDAQIEELRERFATPEPVDRTAVDGDTLTLDLEATVDGEAIEGGTAAGLSYKLGDGTMLAGLDEALADAKEGDARTFQTPLVAGEHEGKTADVAVTVRQVSELKKPEIDDEWVSTVTGMEGGVEAFRADIRERLNKNKRMEQGLQARDKVLEALLALVDFPLPEKIVASEVEFRKKSVADQLAQSGLTMEGYLESESQTQEEFAAELEKGAQDAVRSQILLDAIADAEEVQVGDADLSEQVVRRAQQANISPEQYAQQLVQSNQVGLLAGEIRRGKALAAVMDAATITDSEGVVVDLDALRDELPGRNQPQTQVDENGRPYHVHGDGQVHYLDEDA